MRLLARTTAFGYFPHNLIGLSERLTDHLAEPPPGRARERLWQLRAREVVLATGAIEQPLVFPGNDRPGIMLTGAARSYLHRYGVRAGSRAVVVTATDDAYRAALDLREAGVKIAAIADLRANADGALVQAARGAGIEVLTRATVLGTRGNLRVASIDIGTFDNARTRARAAAAVLRPGADVRWLHAERSSLLAVAREIAVEGGRAHLRAGRLGRARALRRRVPRRARPRGRARGRRHGRCGRRAGLRSSGHPAPLCGDG